MINPETVKETLNIAQYQYPQKWLNATTTIAIIVLSVILYLHLHIGTLDRKFGFDEHSIISDLGLFLWAISAALCFFTFFLMQSKRSESSAFILTSACLSLLLLLDDFLQIHETISHLYEFNEKIYYLILGCIILVYNLRFLKYILRTHLAFYLSAYLFLFGSVVADGVLDAIEVYFGVLAIIAVSIFYLFIAHRKTLKNLFYFFCLLTLFHLGLLAIDGFVGTDDYLTLYEESLKWLGICFWCGYYVNTCYTEVGATNRVV